MTRDPVPPAARAAGQTTRGGARARAGGAGAGLCVPPCALHHGAAEGTAECPLQPLVALLLSGAVHGAALPTRGQGGTLHHLLPQPQHHLLQAGGKLSVVIFYLAVPPLPPTTAAIANGSSSWADSPGQASRLYALGPNWVQERIVWAPTRSALTRTADPFDLCFIQQIIHIPWHAKKCSLLNLIFNRPGVAGAVLQTPLSLINSVSE